MSKFFDWVLNKYGPAVCFCTIFCALCFGAGLLSAAVVWIETVFGTLWSILAFSAISAPYPAFMFIQYLKRAKQ